MPSERDRPATYPVATAARVAGLSPDLLRVGLTRARPHGARPGVLLATLPGEPHDLGLMPVAFLATGTDRVVGSPCVLHDPGTPPFSRANSR